MFPAQIGKTEALICNTLGYYMHHEPAPILAVFEDEGKAEAFSKERLTAMIADTPVLTDLVRSKRFNDPNNTLTFKGFPGGYLAIAGAASESSLTSRPIRILLEDELDKWRAVRAGDPEALAMNRQITFRHRAKTIRVSTPLMKDSSRIEAAYHRSDRRKYYVPCPHCGHEQVLNFRDGLKWVRIPDTSKVSRVWYQCEQCAQEIEESRKVSMLSAGRWIAEQPFRGHAGFWLNVLYSPWVTWREVAERFLSDRNEPGKLQGFLNEWLAESWEEQYARLSTDDLYGRREPYGPEVPADAGVLTAGVDIQENRIEASLWAWGRYEEAWLIEHAIFVGDPSQPDDICWSHLDQWLTASRQRADSGAMQIAAALVDSGYLAQVVYRFCVGKQHRRVYACKGQAGKRASIITRPSKRAKSTVLILSVDMVKDVLSRRLRLLRGHDDTVPRGYVHLPLQHGCDLQYCEQLTAEYPAPAKDRFGRSFHRWTLPPGKRAEALDCLVYAYSALQLLNVRDIGRIVDQYREKPAEDDAKSIEIKEKAKLQRAKKRGWVGRWKSI